MELKLYLIIAFVCLASAFNRTIVELKHTSIASSLLRAVTFNRTIVELKLGGLGVLDGGYDDF